MRSFGKGHQDLRDVMRCGVKGSQDLTDIMRSAAKDPISALLYGSEAWATTLADRRRLDVFDMRCQRRLLCVFWQQHISNQSIRERYAPSNQPHHPPTTTLPALVRTSPPRAILPACTKSL